MASHLSEVRGLMHGEVDLISTTGVDPESLIYGSQVCVARNEPTHVVMGRPAENPSLVMATLDGGALKGDADSQSSATTLTIFG